MIVRAATAEDLPQYIELARMFHAASPMHNVIPFDDEGYSQFYLGAIDTPTIGIWLAEIEGEIVGIAGALLYPMYFSPGTLVAQELWWWLTPKSRGSGAGARAVVTDANATTFHSIVAGGGANVVPVFSDGTNWRIG